MDGSRYRYERPMMRESYEPIEKLLRKQSKNEFLTFKEKERLKQYEAEQRKKKNNKKR